MVHERTRIRTLFEYSAIRGVLGAVRILPPRLAFWLTDRMGDLAYHLDREHRLVAQKNLAAVFGGAAEDQEHRRRARMVFRHFMRVAAEFALLPRLIEKRGLEDVIQIEGRQNVEQALSLGKGVIVFTGHVGNWEVVAAAAEPLGLKLHSVGRTMDNHLLDRFLTRERTRYARSVIPKEGGLREIVRVLRSGEAVAMLLDQHAGRSGIDVDFLGRPASTFRAAAELSVRFGLPLLGGFGVRVDDSPRFKLTFDPPLLPVPGADKNQEVRRLTQAASDAIAERVMSHPEQWNWLHRRWRKKKKRKSKQESRL
ncbi:MAG: lysophospholipid acyltransferase family protein [Planctomycetota bacterium]